MVEHVRYLCPSVEEHGHWVWQEGEAPRIAKVLMKQTSEPVQHGVWVGLETQILDDLSTRRRLREKTTVRRLDASMEAQEEEETEKWKVKARIRRIIEEEMRAMVEDDEETAMDEMAVIGRLRKAVESMEDSEEILQTKIISPKEVWEHWEEWEAAAKSEINSMLEEKEALEEVSEEEVKEIEKKLKEKGIKFECIPSKVVYSKKPIPGGSKHKVRWVICGNYEEKRDDEQTYSAGADATAFRLMLWFAARNQWLGMSLDIRTAFLNAVIDQEDQSNYILVAPPTIFVKKGCLRPGTLYRPKRAVYGLRRSPRLWGLCRDSEMRSFEVEVEKKEGRKIKLQLRQLDSEPNLWRLEEVGKEEGSEPSIQYGLVMTYVDDIFRSHQSGGTEVPSDLDHVRTRSRGGGSHSLPWHGSVNLKECRRSRCLACHPRILCQGPGETAGQRSSAKEDPNHSGPSSDDFGPKSTNFGESQKMSESGR